MGPTQDVKPGTAASNRVERGADRLRESAKWLVASFGAAAAVVLAGINFSSIGSLSPDAPNFRFPVAVGGSVLALTGVLVALLSAMSLASASTVSLDDLDRKPARWDGASRAARAAVEEEPVLAPWGNNVTKVRQKYEFAHQHWENELRLWLQNRDVHASPAMMNRSTHRLNEFQAVIGQMLETASFVRLQHRFRTFRYIIGASLLVAGLGAVLVVWAANPPMRGSGGLVGAIEGRFDVPEAAKEQYRNDLGEGCRLDLDGIPVIVIDVDEEEATAEVVTSPAPACRVLRRAVDSEHVTWAGNP